LARITALRADAADEDFDVAAASATTATVAAVEM
jgi:hypothetical protein